MKIRPATLNDRLEISSLHFASYKKAAEGKFSIDYLNQLTVEKFLARWQARMLDNTLTLVAEEEGKILGILTAMDFDSENAGKNEAIELRYFYVHVDHWRKGIGTKIAIAMAELLIEAGYKSVYGSVLKDDIRANTFYISLGAAAIGLKQIWIPLGTTPESYPEGTYADSVDYAVQDIKQALLQRSTRKNINPPLAALKNESQFIANASSSGISFFPIEKEGIKSIQSFEERTAQLEQTGNEQLGFH